MKKFFGFTLSELMIAITVLGIVTATVLPAVLGTNPNQNKVMMKKAYYTTLDTINEMINNPTYYPRTSETGVLNKFGYLEGQDLSRWNFSNKYVGFDNIERVTINGINYEGGTKFINLFVKELNIKGTLNETASIDEDTICPKNQMSAEALQTCRNSISGLNFEQINKDACAGIVGVGIDKGQSNEYCAYITSKDGITWYFNHITVPEGEYSRLDMWEPITNILVDVNGSKKPNCYQGSPASRCEDREDNFDQFRMQIFIDGSIKIYDGENWVKDALSVTSSLTE